MEFDWTRLAAIPDFAPGSVLGTPGGQGIAVRGTWRGRDVVVKALFPAAFNEVAWEHARAATTITHFNVVHIDYADQVDIDGELIHYVVMPFVEGRTLEEAMQGGKRWSVAQALEIAAQVADGLGAIHAVGRTHRDIKPANILYATGSGAFAYDHAHQGPHYYGSLHRWFRDLRAQAPADRKTYLMGRFKVARDNAPTINNEEPRTFRVRVVQLTDWERRLLR